jgi:glycine/D-amino acid oxidase-like deaminating enzyme/nitrite reductase/ring-hydroxylating ferredoxin subunit
MKSAAARFTTSVWSDTVRLPELNPIREDITKDVCIVGAGMAGISCAYLLALAGKSVVVVEASHLASGQTAHTTAHLSTAFDDRYCDLIKVHDTGIARLVAESHSAAIDRIERNIKRENIDCDFKRLDGFLFQPTSSADDLLERELKAIREIGIIDVEMAPRAPLADFDTGPCLRFKRQGQFHPLKYLNGLVTALKAQGHPIFTGTHVTKIEGGEKAYVQTARGPIITASAVIVATNSPINDTVVIHTKQAPYMTYVVGCMIPAGSAIPALYWDTLDPYHYVRLQPMSAAQDLLIVGGEDHKLGQADDHLERWDRLAKWAGERFPLVNMVSYRWSGIVMESIDGLAFIGKNPLDKDNIFIVTGDSGMGMTHGTIASMLLTDLITGKENPWQLVYDPSRKPLWGMAGQRFMEENLNVAERYIKDWLGPAEVSDINEIARGSGAIMRRGISKSAVYHDLDGTIHTLSAACTHLGCVVHWNSEEKSWDCPCHGSRFDPYGAVINGPANTPLKKLERPFQDE